VQSTAVRPAGGRPTHVRWVVLALLVLASFVAYVLRTNMSIAGESLTRELGLSQVQLGVVLAAFAWGYALFQFPGGVFGDRIGARRALTALAVAWGVLTLLVGVVPGSSTISPGGGVGLLVVLRFLMGAVQAPLYPVTGGGMIGHWFPVSGWALPNGLTNAGLTLGSAATGPLVAWLTLTVGWRQSFLLTAPLAFALAAVWWWYARDTPAEHTSVNAAERALIEADRPRVDAPPEPGAWRRVLAHPQVLLLTLSYFCSNYVFYFFFNWLYIYLVDVRGFAALAGGFFSAAPWMVGAVGAVAGGYACDALASRLGPHRGYRIMPIAGLSAAAVLIVAAALAPDAYVAVVLLALCLGFQQLTEGAFWAATIAVAGRHASAACGVLNTGGNIVGGVGALVVPVVAESFGWVTAVATSAVFALVGAALWLVIRPERTVEG
jgi:ACS family glucarate transporter-like MFS transporter